MAPSESAYEPLDGAEDVHRRKTSYNLTLRTIGTALILALLFHFVYGQIKACGLGSLGNGGLITAGIEVWGNTDDGFDWYGVS